MRQVVYINPDTGVITMTLRCDYCDEHGWDIDSGYKCSVCHGTGYVDVDFVPITEADLDLQDEDGALDAH